MVEAGASYTPGCQEVVIYSLVLRVDPNDNATSKERTWQDRASMQDQHELAV